MAYGVRGPKGRKYNPNKGPQGQSMNPKAPQIKNPCINDKVNNALDMKDKKRQVCKVNNGYSYLYYEPDIISDEITLLKQNEYLTLLSQEQINGFYHVELQRGDSIAVGYVKKDSVYIYWVED